jgi:hypothetical protein
MRLLNRGLYKIEHSTTFFFQFGRVSPANLISARSPWKACLVQRDAGDSADCVRLRSLPDCQAEDALFAVRPLQARHLVLGAPLFAVAATP